MGTKVGADCGWRCGHGGQFYNDSTAPATKGGAVLIYFSGAGEPGGYPARARARFRFRSRAFLSLVHFQLSGVAGRRAWRIIATAPAPSEERARNAAPRLLHSGLLCRGLLYSGLPAARRRELPPPAAHRWQLPLAAGAVQQATAWQAPTPPTLPTLSSSWPSALRPPARVLVLCGAVRCGTVRCGATATEARV